MNKIFSMLATVTIWILALVIPYTCALAQTPEWVVYNEYNSGFPGGDVHAMVIDENGTKWIGVQNEGLVSFDGMDWMVFNSDNSGLLVDQIRSLAIDDSGILWIGAYAGGLFGSLVPRGVNSYDGTIWTEYTSANSGLPDNCVNSIAIESNGTKWFGTMDGSLSSFDGSNWTVYNSSNTGMPSSHIWSIGIDGSNDKWLGTDGAGLVHFDGITWTIFNSSNSSLTGDMIYTIAIDEGGTKWIGMYDQYPYEGSSGLSSFDGANWIVYYDSNAGLPSNFITAIAIDVDGTKWIATPEGLAKFDGSTWTIYNEGNSGLPNNHVQSIAIDADGNKWIATWDGICVFNEAGVVGIDDQEPNSSPPVGFKLLQNYPNPFNTGTTISYALPVSQRVTITIHNLLGQTIATLVDKPTAAGYHNVHWDAGENPGGIYFVKLQTDTSSLSNKMVLLK